MKKDRSQHLEQLHVEMELRNYSPRTIATYGDLMSKVEKFFGQSIEWIFRTILTPQISE